MGTGAVEILTFRQFVELPSYLGSVDVGGTSDGTPLLLRVPPSTSCKACACHLGSSTSEESLDLGT